MTCGSLYGGQMRWLETELMDSEGPAMVFSPSAVKQESRGIRNAEQLSELFRKLPKEGARYALV